MPHAYLTYVPAFPKPSQVKRELPHVKVFPGGREVCETRLDKPEGAEGRAEYKRRKEAMWKRQKGICCLYGFLPECPGKLEIKLATFEHENGRGGGKRDDRISLPDGTWINGVSHLMCNSLKGSKHIPFNRARNALANSKST
jgi:hypothetical protein